MRASVHKAAIFGTILALHGAAAVGLMHVRHQVVEVTSQPVAVRMIATPQEPPATPQPIEVKTIAPTITLDPPELPIVDIPQVVESSRAITLPTRVAAPAPMPAEHSGPKLVSTVEYIRLPQPRYPPQSRKLREQGLVMLRVLIDEKGNARSIEIENSSGYTRLDHAAREAVSRAVFRPYVEEGEARRAVVLIPIEFYLNRSSA